MTKRSKPNNTVPLRITLRGELRTDLTLLTTSRKLANATGKPVTTIGIMDAAVQDLATTILRGTKIAFAAVPISPVTVSVRLSRDAHALAANVSRNAEIRTTDFIRTAVSRYIHKHQAEIQRLARLTNKAK